MTDEELARKELEDEIFNGIMPETADDEAEETVQEDDPWENVPGVIKEELEGLRGKLSNFEQIEYRLKQAESRLGGVLNELHAAKEAANQVSDAPSAKQIKDAAGNQESWDALKEDFSEWAEAIEYKIATANADILSKIPKYEAPDNDALRIEFIGGIVSTKHENWEQIRDEPEFNQWREANNRPDSWNPIHIIKMLDDYQEYKAGLRSPKEILASRKQRLDSAEIVKGKPIRTIKSEDDMSIEEIRQLEAERIWAQ